MRKQFVRLRELRSTMLLGHHGKTQKRQHLAAEFLAAIDRWNCANRAVKSAHKKSPCGWGSNPQRANDVGSLRKPDFSVPSPFNQTLLQNLLKICRILGLSG